MSAASRTVALAKLDRLEFGVGYPDRYPAARRWRSIARMPGNFDASRRAPMPGRSAPRPAGRPQEWWIAPRPSARCCSSSRTPTTSRPRCCRRPVRSGRLRRRQLRRHRRHRRPRGQPFRRHAGADYDAIGARRTWWTAADRAGYDAATAPLVEQFSGYRPFPISASTGENLSENLADLGGLAAAFDAYRRSIGDRASDPELVRRLDRQFFIGFARAWRSKIRRRRCKQVASDDTHAPESYRVATVRNLDAWYTAFDVQPGDRLYLAPEQRVKVW